MSAFDRRLVPARPDLAAEHLRGPGRRAAIRRGHAAPASSRRLRRCAASPTRTLRSTPRRFSASASPFMTSSRAGPGGSWRATAMSAGCRPTPWGRRAEPCHRVFAVRTFVYPVPSIKRPHLMALTMGSEVSVDEEVGLFCALTGGGFVFSGHLAPSNLSRRRSRDGRRALSRHPLSVGRQDEPRPRLLGSRSDRPASLWRSLPA